MLRYTTTLGVRRQDMARYALDRRVEVRATAFGDVRYKVSEGYGVQRVKPEYDDVAAIALREGLPFSDVLQRLENA